ncbi:alpha amylase C-terminal domain-containing protein [bacterium]|nr:alpha amylase C-terminal domain-containing protein [bacterium]
MKLGAVNSVKVSSYPNAIKEKKAENSLKSGHKTSAPILYGYKPLSVSFGRMLSEHKSWGATVNIDNRTVNFKLFTYPETERVYVELLQTDDADECKDINARGINVHKGHSYHDFYVKPEDRRSKMFELEKGDFGVFTLKNVPARLDNTFYRFIIVKNENDIRIVKDPYSKEQPSILGWSKIHNPNDFNWTDSKWMSKRDSRRITRLAQSGTKGVNSLRIYEMNIPTVRKGGNFESAISKLEEIKSKNLANAVEIMPVENTYSKQWGYDGVDKFAVNDKIGGSRGLKEFINRAHELGISVIIDMVPNHIGPDGDMLGKTGPYEGGSGAFGSIFNYEGKENQYVRDYVSNMALNWLGEYHADGLRLDMTNPNLMGSDYTLKQIVTEVNEHYPDAFMIAEDGANNREKITAPLPHYYSHAEALYDIDRNVNALANNQGTIEGIDGIGFDSEWDFPFMRQVLNMTETPENTDMGEFDNRLKNSHHRVAYSISHDEIGNLDGTSSVVKYANRKMQLFNNIPAENFSKQFQKASHATYELLKLYSTGKLDKMTNYEFNNFVSDKLEVKRHVSKQEVREAYDYALKKLKLALGTVYTIPGPKMYFQGADEGRIDYFQFFRKLSDVDSRYPDTRQRMAEMKKNMDAEKGYDTDFEKSYKVSTIGNVNVVGEAKDKLQKMSDYTTAINDLVEKNPALQDGRIDHTICFDREKVHCVHCVKDSDEIFAVKNYSDDNYNEFKIVFPSGEWQEVINSNDERFAGDGRYLNNGRFIYGNGYDQKPIKLGSNTVSVFKRVG